MGQRQGAMPEGVRSKGGAGGKEEPDEADGLTDQGGVMGLEA